MNMVLMYYSSWVSVLTIFLIYWVPVSLLGDDKKAFMYIRLKYSISFKINITDLIYISMSVHMYMYVFQHTVIKYYLSDIDIRIIIFMMV